MEGQTTYEYIRAQRAESEQVERETGSEDQKQAIGTIPLEVKTGGQSSCDCEIFRGNRVGPEDQEVQVPICCSLSIIIVHSLYRNGMRIVAT